MIQKTKNQNISYKAFTLIEMIIVLIIIGIMLMATIFLSGEQIQKVKDKTVKESILAEMQSRYSRNLGSSSYGSGKIYDTMNVTFSGSDNKIVFNYNSKSGEEKDNTENTFSDRFEIKYIAKNYNYNGETPNSVESITLKYSPYQISCQMLEEGDGFKNVVIIARVNDSIDYCFEIPQKNCRLIEVSKSKCSDLKNKAHLE